MSNDRRERVLARLVEIGKAIPGIKTSIRNRALAEDEELPVVQILDADEAGEDNDPLQRTNRATRRFIMTPEIYVVLEDQEADVGTTLNGFRCALVKAILEDTQLKAILGTNGEIRYDGCSTGLARNRLIVGELGLHVKFYYPLIESEL
jgi:hypothetical protein